MQGPKGGGMSLGWDYLTSMCAKLEVEWETCTFKCMYNWNCNCKFHTKHMHSHTNTNTHKYIHTHTHALTTEGSIFSISILGPSRWPVGDPSLESVLFSEEFMLVSLMLENSSLAVITCNYRKRVTTLGHTIETITCTSTIFDQGDATKIRQAFKYATITNWWRAPCPW